MKNIFINALSALEGGGQTYLNNLLSNRKKGQIKIFLLINSRSREVFSDLESDDLSIIESEFASKHLVTRLFWEKFSLPKLLKQLNIDVYFAPGGILAVKGNSQMKTVVAFQNMSPFDPITKYPFSFERYRVKLLKYAFLKSFRNADKILFISNYAQQVIQDYLGNVMERSTVIYHGLGDNFRNPDPEFQLSEEVINTLQDSYLYVSKVDAYKSHDELVDAWKVLSEQEGFNSKLVFVGGVSHRYGEALFTKIKELGLEEKVIYLGKVQYEQLPHYYHNAKAIIFASICENCPNILLESLASGKLVYCSQYQPMPEFGQDAVVYIDPLNVDSIVENLSKNYESVENEFKVKAKKRSDDFDWDECWDETVEFLISE